MGSCQSVCGKEPKKKTPEPTSEKSPENEEEEEEQMEDIDNGVMVAKNKDNYFSKEDFEKIETRFPTYKEMSQSLAMSRIRPKHKKIKWRAADIIGNGSFGRVIMGLNLQTGAMMAVKQVQIGSTNNHTQQERITALEQEIEFLSQFSHKNIVSYFGSQKTKTNFNIFLEYVSGGTIADLVEKFGPLNETLIKRYTRQILEGLEYLHLRNIVHRDIKGANVLVDNDGTCKLADFGTAKRISAIVDGETKYMPSIRGTVNWMAPEVIRQTNLGRYSDIWSVGCTVLEMATGKVPWSNIIRPNATQFSALYQIGKAEGHPPIPDNLTPEANDFLKQCFKMNPAERSNVIALLNHKFLAGPDLDRSGQDKEIKAASASLGDEEKLKLMKNKAMTPVSARNKKPEILLKPDLDLSRNKSNYFKYKRNSNSGFVRSEEAESMQTFENNENAVKGLSHIIPEDDEKRSNAARLSSRHEDFDNQKLKTEDIENHRNKLKSLADIYGSANKVPSKQEVAGEEKSKAERNVSSPDPLASTYETTIQGINNANNGSKLSKISLNTAGKPNHISNKLDPLDIANIARDTGEAQHSRRRSKLRPLGQTSSRQTIHSQNDEEDLSSINASALGYAFRRGSKQQNGIDAERRRSHFGEAAEGYANILINPPIENEDPNKNNPIDEEVTPFSPKDKVLTYRQTLGQSLKMESPGVFNKADLDAENPESDHDDIEEVEEENCHTTTPVYQHQSMSSAKFGTLADPMSLSQAQNNLQNAESYKRFVSINQYGSNKAKEFLPFEVVSAGLEDIQFEEGNPMDTLEVGRPSFHHRDHKDVRAITEEDSAYDPKRSQNKLENSFKSSENVAGNKSDHEEFVEAVAHENQMKDDSISMEALEGQAHAQEEEEDNPMDKMSKYYRKSPTSARQRTTSDGFLQFESMKLQTNRNRQTQEE